MREALDIQVKGIVQGVGFRPFVYRLAKKYLIDGWVLNAADGVYIHAEGESKLLDEFVIELSENPPAASCVEEVDLKEVPLEDFNSFEIHFSDKAAVEKTTLVSPDLATCDDCVCELFDPHDRRYRYPFINCTNCGPRFTIIEGLPYDRASTSMKDFPMCERCASEYADPLDRRFHAQPDACFDCGPHISWCEHEQNDIAAPLGKTAWGRTREESDAIIARAVELLCAGKILAVKGLGGFHLVCDADNAEAVALLRTRKHREGKAFAVMMNSVEAIRRICRVNEAEAQVLVSVQRPIVLVRKRSDSVITSGLADGLPELGVMLPYTPLQHLLLHDFNEIRSCGMLVMTSANLHDEPIVIDDEDAYVKLFSVADAFLGNDRAIRTRYDDSVLRVIRIDEDRDAVQFIRRARGYAPLPAALPKCSAEETKDSGDVLSILAVGPEQKNTFTLTRGTEAFVSQHIGDMENAETYDAWLAAKHRYEQLFDIVPYALACDTHPEYLTTKWAHEESSAHDMPLYEVQHHHAHIASVLGEQNMTGPVCGIAFDGTGYGVDGALWGGEVLLANLVSFERFANFVYVPMPGGAAAIKHPLRMAYGVLWAFDLLNHPAAKDVLVALGSQAAMCGKMIEQAINTPFTSSVGRLFDAASALLGVCTEPKYEGEPAILLEGAITDANAFEGDVQDDEVSRRYAVALVKNAATPTGTAKDTSVVLFDAASTFKALLDDKEKGVPIAVIAQRFHNAFVQVIVAAAEFVRGLYDINTVALSGGVFMNRYLTEHTLAALETAGFMVIVNKDLPPNDGCVSFGQAVVAWALNETSSPADVDAKTKTSNVGCV